MGTQRVRASESEPTVFSLRNQLVSLLNQAEHLRASGERLGSSAMIVVSSLQFIPLYKTPVEEEETKKNAPHVPANSPEARK